MTNVKPIPETGELWGKIYDYVETAYEDAERTGKDQCLLFMPETQEFKISDKEGYRQENLVFFVKYQDFVALDEDLAYDEYDTLRVYRDIGGEWLPDGEVVNRDEEFAAYLERKMDNPETIEKIDKGVKQVMALSRQTGNESPWSQIIKKAKDSGEFTVKDADMATDWKCCAVGEKFFAENPDLVGAPSIDIEDHITANACNAGISFEGAVQCDDPERAEKILKQIQDMRVTSHTDEE